MRLFAGGYTADMDAHAEGIGVLHAGSPDGVLAGGALRWAGTAAASASPSWIAWHPTQDVIYAAQEGAGTVQAFRRTGEESFASLGAAVAVGGAPCHVAVAPDGRSLIASCYGDGRVVRLTLDAAGRPAAPAAAPAAALVADVPGLAELPAGAPAPHAHQARFTPAGLITTDLGLDLVRSWDVRGDGLAERHRVALPAGSGPRHSVWHPSGHLYVVTEYSNEVFVLRPAPGGALALVGGAQLVGAQVGADYPAEIALTRDAQYAVVGIRGSNTLATLRVGGDGSALATVALVESGVDWPRHHVIARDTVLVAGQRSNEVVSLTIDERTGVPGRVRHRVDAPTPTCLLPDR
ncbi:beta-propeller fold lactonase family protein [Microbacterium aurum]|uniref:lactonase family protein n=1 Tax=Microbacterium aurum TaxID=36805 RepID=UPI0028F174C1|nr:beta-propeller fold lactonase family protein [Microbacterium aurum]